MAVLLFKRDTLLIFMRMRTKEAEGKNLPQQDEQQAMQSNGQGGYRFHLKKQTKQWD